MAAVVENPVKVLEAEKMTLKEQQDNGVEEKNLEETAVDENQTKKKKKKKKKKKSPGRNRSEVANFFPGNMNICKVSSNIIEAKYAHA